MFIQKTIGLTKPYLQALSSVPQHSQSWLELPFRISAQFKSISTRCDSINRPKPPNLPDGWAKNRFVQETEHKAAQKRPHRPRSAENTTISRNRSQLQVLARPHTRSVTPHSSRLIGRPRRGSICTAGMRHQTPRSAEKTNTLKSRTHLRRVEGNDGTRQ